MSAAAGTGKTALADRFLQRVSLRSDTVILGARCYEREGLPFKGVDSLIDQLTHFLTDSDIPLERISRRDVACLAAVFPVVAGVSAFAEAARAGVLSLDRVVLRRSALAALREVLVLIGQRRKLVIWLDDLHWIDRDSAELLHDVLCSSDPPLLLLLCTHRADLYPPMRLLLELLEREPIAKTSMDLKPLDADDAALLAESMLSRTVQNPHERALSIARDSGGLPIFICELARAAARLGAERLSLGSVIWRRVLALDEDSRKFMYILSIAGRPIAQALAFSAAGIESLNPIILNSLTQMGLVCTGGPGPTDTVEPYHDRIRETITKEIGAVEKRNLHRELARVLEGSPDPDPEMLASHLEACGELLKAGIYYERAAERAAVGVAFNTAAELYRRSLSLRDLSSEERARIELRLAEVLANAGKSAEASGCYFSAAQHLPSDERLRIEGLAAYHLCVGGHLDEARTKIEQLLGQIGRRPLGTGPRAIVKVLWHDLRCRLRGTCQRPASAGDVDPILLAQIDLLWFAAAGLGTSDLLGGFYLLQLSMELAQKAREPARMVRAYAWYAAMQVGQRLKHEHIETVFQRCRELSKQIGDPPASRATLAVTTAVRHYLVGSWLEALLNCREAERLLLEECHGLNWELAFTRGLKLTLLMNTGAISGLERQAREIMEDALSRGDLATATTIAAFPLPYSQILNGKPAVARDTWRYWVERWPPYLVRSNQEPYSVLIELWSYLYENDSDRAFALLRQRWEASIVHSQTLRLPVAAVYFLETRARILIQAAGRSHALQQQKLLNEPRRIIAKLRASPALHAKAHAMQIEALLHAIDGRSDIAVSAMRESSTMFQQCHMTIHAAASRLHAGRWMGGDLGQGWIAEAAQLMRSEGIADPDAVSRMLVSEIGP